MKKSYNIVSIKQQEDIFIILLDGRKLLTPGKNPLYIKTQSLAEAIMKEWSSQGQNVVPSTMPFTQMMMTAQDIISPKRKETCQEIFDFLPTDLVLFHDAQKDVQAFQRQMRENYLQDFNQKWNAQLSSKDTLKPFRIDPDLEFKIMAHMSILSDESLAALKLAVICTGSFILGASLQPSSALEKLISAIYAEEIYFDQKIKQAGLAGDPELPANCERTKKELLNIKDFLSLIG